MSASTAFIYASGLSKHFAGITALDGVDFEVLPGEIHALVGENGAGKSTLAKIIAGVHRADGGDLLVDGKPSDFHHPLAALQAGIAMVHQELKTIGSISIAANIMMGREPARFGWVNRRSRNAQAARYLEQVGLDIDPGRLATGLSVGKLTLIDVATALAAEARLVIMDEPTSSLPTSDAAHLLGIMRRIADSGRSVVLISHNLEEVLSVADRVTVLRDGERITTEAASQLTEDLLIQKVVGRKVEQIYTAKSEHHAAATTADRLLVEGLSAPGVEAASFSARPTEVLGFGGLVGSGRTELMAAVMGATKATGGRMQVAGKRYRPRSPLDALNRGVALVPESRKDDGLILEHSVLANFELTALDRFSTGPFANPKAARARAAALVDRLNIRLASLDQPVSSLSGGNQQKVVIAKALAVDPSVLLLDEPTRGIDIGAKSEIHHFIRELTEEGMAVVMVSSVLPELLQASDRIMVMKRGRTVAELDGRTATEEEVTSYAFRG